MLSLSLSLALSFWLSFGLLALWVYERMSVCLSVREQLVFLAFIGGFCITTPAHPHATEAVVYTALLVF